MINQITCNSNNAIEMSRGQLLQWLNNLLKLNYTKIEQLGTGAAYCQILDIIYPNKVPISKVNWKAKFDYQYLNNFKVLQQSFTKLNIMKHIDVEKLVKCKYQDNLEFLQWFKKIYDVACNGKPATLYDPQIRRGEIQNQTNQLKVSNSKEKLCVSHYSNSFSETDQNEKENLQQYHPNQNQKKSNVLELPSSHTKQRKRSFQSQEKVTLSTQKLRSEQKFLIQNLHKNQNKQQFGDLRKIKQIQHLMQTWKGQNSIQLAKQIKKILLASQDDYWKIQNGKFCTIEQSIECEIGDE